MDTCSSDLKAYITVEEHERILKQAIQSQFEILESEYVTKHNEMATRFSRADNFLTRVAQRIPHLKHYQAMNKTTLPVNDIQSLSNNDAKLTLEAMRAVDKLLQMGFDFEVLLSTMKNDERLTNQWKSIVMTMRLAGYDKFDKDE